MLLLLFQWVLLTFEMLSKKVVLSWLMGAVAVVSVYNLCTGLVK